MDRQIKKRLTMDIIIYPYISTVDGDKLYGAAKTLKGYVIPKNIITTDRNGVEIKVQTAITLDGLDIDNISQFDEVSAPFVSRCPIKKIIPYPSLIPGIYELLEVLL
jgi:hypothetical protein